ncbi:ATP-dependent RNA helicase [Actinocorallia libanotica]|uniref:ATP-dependent helicase HrpB n=1 Tax=Actinocorallia libanotica TaxID=46162 RepID=A0ABN1S084_9ACTN
MRGLDLPIREALPSLETAVASGAAVLTAPPGTGKTTLVPLALAGLLGGASARVLVAEPRRIAARAAARRMAWMLEEPVGRRVGFTVRGEHRPGSRVEAVTTGVLLQRLQRDPELAGVDVVVVDECHERHLDADTALAFLLEVRQTLRPDLKVVAASATADAARWAALLEDAPVVEAASVLHPLTEVWAPPPRAGAPAHGTRVDPALLDHVARTVRRAWNEQEGGVLCFLPGVGELRRVAGALADLPVLQLHGQAPAETQDAALDASAGRRVILATSVAESSLTLPGIRAVVDAGLAREPRTDHTRGLGALTTVRVSRAAAEQRAGRAAREAPGTVYRCWPESERLAPWPQPEIALADLAPFALHLACWGTTDPAELALLTPPPEAALAAARSTLHGLSALDAAGRATARGRRMNALGLHPRLARALLDASPRTGARRAAELVALLSEPLPSDTPEDLVTAWRRLRTHPRWKTETRRLRSALHDDATATAPHEDAASAPHIDASSASRGGGISAPHGEAASSAGGGGAAAPRDGTASASQAAASAPRTVAAGERLSDEAAAGLVVALAYPERVARARASGGHLMASGTGATVPGGLARAAWLAVAVADRPVGAASARVRQAVEIDEATAREAAAALLDVREEVLWEGGAVRAREVELLGAIELSARPVEPGPEAVREALLGELRRAGPAFLDWSGEARRLRERLDFLHRALGGPWPAVDDAALTGRAAGQWAEAPARPSRSAEDLLRGMLPWPEAARLEELAPERIAVPSGSRVKVDYSGERPVLAVKLQELFGWPKAPALAGGRVPLLVHLLSPAGRPAAVTADLESFWREGYRAVRAELRGRYPRHPWPEDPAAAAPTARTNRALRDRAR